MEYVSELIGFSFDFNHSSAFPTFRKLFFSVKDHFIPHAGNNYHPHVLKHRFLGLLSLLLVTVKVTAIALPLVALSPVSPADASAITQSNIISLTNSSRAENNLPALTLNGKLTRAAQAKADDMLARQYFSHNTPDGRTPWSFIKNAGYSYLSAGENLAVDFSEAENVETAWMNSPGHRANILNNSYQEIGIGISSGLFEGHQTTFVVQMFGTPLAANIALQDQPTKVAAAAPAPAPAPVTAPTPPPAPVQASAAPIQATAARSTPPKVASTTPAVASVAPAPTPPAAQQQVTEAQLPADPATPLTNPPTISLEDAAVRVTSQGVSLTTLASPETVKIIANYGSESAMLYPKPDNVWQANLPLANLSGSEPISLVAYDMSGQATELRVASLSPDLRSSFGSPLAAAGSVEGASISLFGKELNPKNLENQFYMIIIAALLSCMVLAIGIKRHVQHLSLIANSSFVTMLAALLWMAR